LNLLNKPKSGEINIAGENIINFNKKKLKLIRRKIAFIFQDYNVLDNLYTVENVLVGEKLNDNTFTNKFQDVTPTGLLIDNLPFILMIGLGLAGFVALSKKRRQA